ncbi:MAG: polyprenyl synthetase family protein [candidate division WOR-3 bacterium]|nr:polyprenyl synthetase family protein [candidate division WOR-3 bacterium]
MMELAVFFEEKRRLVNKALAKEFTRPGTIPQPLFAAMRYSVFSGGKRIRPILSLTTFETCNGKNLNWILPFACGIELIHTYSLINDDLPCMDDDDWRREKPTLHKAFDETTAVLASSALFAKAFELFTVSKAPPIRRIRAISDITKTIGADGIVAGQIMDIKGNISNLPILKKIQRKKTAEFIAVSVKTGAVIAGAKDKIIKKLWQAGIELGMLFQITDDILDAKQDKANQPSLVKFYDLNRARRIAQDYALKAKDKFSSLGKRFEPLIMITDWIAKRSN